MVYDRLCVIFIRISNGQRDCIVIASISPLGVADQNQGGRVSFTNSATNVTFDLPVTLSNALIASCAAYKGSSAISFGTNSPSGYELTKVRIYTGTTSSNSYAAFIITLGQ